MCKRGHTCLDFLSLIFFLSMEMKSFDPGCGSPKTENVSSCTTFLLPLNFQLLRKGSYAEGNFIYFSLQPRFLRQMFWGRILDIVFLPLRFPASRVCLQCGCTCPPALDSATVAAFHFLHAQRDGWLDLPSPPLSPAVWREEPRSCITSSYLPSVFPDAIAVFQNTE